MSSRQMKATGYKLDNTNTNYELCNGKTNSSRLLIIRGVLTTSFVCASFWFFFFSDQQRTISSKSAYAKNMNVRKTEARSFGIEGEDIYQFLKAFGSEVVAERVVNAKLNCDSYVVREELREKSAVIDVMLDCECVDSSDDEIEPERLRGEWKFFVNNLNNPYEQLDGFEME